MRAAVLFSGGKDSCYALHLAYLQGYDVVALLTVVPTYEGSMLYHKPVELALELQSRSLGVPLERVYSHEPSEELPALKGLLEKARRNYGVRAVFTGAVVSDFQRMLFSMVAQELDVKVVNPLWRADQERYLFELIDSGIEFMLVSISTYGLPPSFLGRTITHSDAREIVERARKYGFNPSLDGGEAETLATNAPLFKHKLVVEGRAVSRSEYEHFYSIEKVYLR